MNNINNNHANLQMAYNNAHHTGGQGYGSNNIGGNNIGHANNVPYGVNNHVYSRDYSAMNSNAMQGGGGGGGGIGKISDYDPITDGPRNIPNTTRPSSTLIYSSDRGMGKNILHTQRENMELIHITK